MSWWENMSTWEKVRALITTTTVIVILEIYKAHDRITTAIWLLVGLLVVVGILDYFLQRYQVVLKSGTGSFRERYELRRRTSSDE